MATGTSDKGMLSKIYKEHWNLNNEIKKVDENLPTKNKLRKRKAELKDTTMTSGIRTYVIKCSKNNKQTPNIEFGINK